MRTACLTAGFTLTAFFCATAAGADTRLLNLVMPDATTIAGANVTNAETTPFGQYVLAQLTSTFDQELKSFVTATGFDPRRDVTEVLAATSSSINKPAGLVLALGNFQVAQITAALASKAPELSVQTYGGATLITGSSAKATGAAAFLGNNIAILGDTASVKAAIDRSGSANSINTALAVQVQNLSTTQDAWVATTSSFTTLIPGMGGDAPAAGAAPSPMPQFAQMFKNIQSSSGGIKFGSVVQITGQAVTTDAATAKSLADVMQALVSIMSLAGGQDPQMVALAQIAQGLKVTADGTTINLALSIPEAQLESLINSMKAKPAAKATVKPAMLRQ